MMIGALKPPLRRSLHRLAPVHVRQPDIQQDQVEVLVLTTSIPFAAVSRGQNVEFLVERQLIVQRLAKVVIVIDDEHLPRCAHAYLLREM